MAIIKVTGFTGEAPRIAPRLLPPSGAQVAQSVRLEDGELAPFRKPYPVYEIPGVDPGDVKTIYRHLDEWLSWATVVHAAPGPVAQDRLYYTGDGVPKMRVGSTVYSLKVTPPPSALTAVRSGSLTAVTETRLYVYTHVTDYGEESEPNPVSNEVVVSPGNTVDLSGFTAAPAGRAITKQRIYRAQTSATGATQFYFIAERAASTSNYVDSIASENFNEPLPSLDWNMPPDGLSGLVSLPNGMMAAFVGKDLYFCEPWRPHAWPEKYVLTADYDIVGLAAYGTTLVVGTEGNPYLVSGTTPDTMFMSKMELNMPCLSAQGMVDLGHSVAYPSHDGLVVVQNGAATVLTANLLTRDQWLELDPATLVCGQFYGRFFASFDYVDAEGTRNTGTLIIDLTGADPFLIRSQHKADACFYEVASGTLFMLIGDVIHEWDSSQSINDVLTWRSKSFVMKAPTSFGAILFEIDLRDQAAVLAFEEALAAAAAANEARFAEGPLNGEVNGNAINGFDINGDDLSAMPPAPYAAVTVYADQELLATVTRAGDMQRLPGGKLAREWEIEVNGNIRVLEVTLAGTGQELREA